MLRDKERWWWNLENQRIAKFAKCEIVPHNKKFQLCMSIAFDQK
jgi:hypothetical protein